ncbi:MAG: tetratricopeptide repeat protein, partial [Acidimicrobiia bacterium]
ELLGELLLELNEPAQALGEFEAALERSPNRLRGLYGAAHAARRAGNVEKALALYARLVEIAKNANGQRSELREAEAFLKGRRGID